MTISDTDSPDDGGDEALRAAHALASGFLASLPQRPVSRVPTPLEMALALDEALPESGGDPAAVVGQCSRVPSAASPLHRLSS